MSDAARLADLFDAAMALPVAARAAFLDGACAGDAVLRAQVERWLAADAAMGDFLEHPAVRLDAAALAEVEPKPPARIGPYRVLRSLGVGGMGEVWLAERDDGEFEQRVAIKQVAWPTPGLLQRFRQERQILARLEHPRIARLLDGGVDERGLPYFAMAFVDGVPITRFADAHALDARARVALLLEVCDAVRFAHQNLVVHRDLKPSNILVDADGAPQLLDFGVAKLLATTAEPAGDGATGTGLRLLTPDYAAPEQFRGGAVTTATDIHALGVVLHELLAGRRPLARDGHAPVPAAHAREALPASDAVDAQAPDARQRRRLLRGDLDHVIARAIAVDPAQRYGSVDAFAADLRQWLAGRPVAAFRRGRVQAFAKLVRRNRVASLAAVVAVLALLGGATIALLQAHRAGVAAERAERGNAFLIEMIGDADPYYGGKPPLLVDALDRSVARIPQRLAGQPLLEADIRRAIGHAYAVLHRDADAKTQLDAAATLRAADGGCDYARVLQSQGYLAWQAAHYEDALALYARGLGTCAGDAPAARAQRANLRNDQASLLADIGRYDESLRAGEASLAEAAGVAGIAPREHATTLSNIASALDGLGRSAQAETTYRRALAEFEAIDPPSEYDIAILYNNLAYLQDAQGHLDDAVQLQERAVALSRKLLGPQNPDLAVKNGNLAVRYMKVGRLDEAQAAIDAALAVAPSALAATDQKRGNLHAIAARVALARHDATQAADQARAALAVYDVAEALEPGRREKAQQTLDAALVLAAAAGKPATR